jgi:hypothetical protein
MVAVVMVVVWFRLYHHHVVVMNMLHPMWNMDYNAPATESNQIT